MIMSDENNNNQTSNTTNETESNDETIIKKKTSISESKGKWGERKGDIYRFNKAIKTLDKSITVYPTLSYKKINEKIDSDNKRIIILKLVGQEQTVEFDKDNLYKNFGRKIKRKSKGGKSHSIWCNNDEYKIIKEILLPILHDEKYLRILQSNDIKIIKDLLDKLEMSNNIPNEIPENDS